MFVLIVFIFSFLVTSLFFATSAFAYLDPNAGGIFLQVIVPIIFGTAAAITVFWRRLMARIKNVFNRSKEKTDSAVD
jgi:hypothetical protein